MSDDQRAEGGARHSIGVVADRTGLSVHQLRAWERRHGAVEPERTEGGHRLYSDRDLHRLQLLSRLTEGGRRIGQLADLSTRELGSLLARDRGEPEAPGADDGDASSAGREELRRARRDALEAVEEFDADRLETVVRRASLKHDLLAFVEVMVLPVLTEVGTRWHEGELGVAQEHMASGVLSRALQHMLEGAAAAADAPRIVLATPSGHRHELGAMAAAAVAGSEGWNVLYLGADLPAAEIARTAREIGARAVALSLVYGPDGASTGRELRELREALPESTTLLLGGRGAAASWHGEESRRVRLASGFGEFGALLRELRPGDGEGAGARGEPGT